MKVIKRDGRAVDYNSEKICVAIEKANREVFEYNRATEEEISRIIDYIESLNKRRILVEDIQDIIEQKLMEFGRYELAKKYIVYRYTRALVRKQNTTDESILGLIKNVGSDSRNSAENSMVASVQRNLIAGEVSKDLTKRILLPEKITKAHEGGIIFFHAMEYFLQPIINTCYINMGDMLDNGTVINNNKISTPETFIEACTVFSKIIDLVANSQYGKLFVNINHLGKYLRKSYELSKLKLIELREKNSESLGESFIDILTQRILDDELSEGVRVIKYQINSIINTYEKNPRVVLILSNEKTDEYYNENKMIIDEILKQKIENCEMISDANNDKRYQYEGHFNYGMVSINLPKIAISSDKDEKKFWSLLDERLELCYEALMCRHYALLGTISDVSPIHWQNGAIARLAVGERIDSLLKDGYSDIPYEDD